MTSLFLIIAACAVFYAIKGGSGNVFKNWNRVRARNKILDRLLDGKVLSTIGMGILAIVLFPDRPLVVVALMIAWLVSIAPSMGEEHGAVGDYSGAWGEYITRGFGRSYGVKKAIQRGLVFGAAFTLATGYIPFILASLLFVPAIWIGQSLNRIILKQPGWALAEPIIGAVVVGVPLAGFVG